MELLQVPLHNLSCQLCAQLRRTSHCDAQDVGTYSKISIGPGALGQSLANIVHEVLLAAASAADGLLLELD